MDTPKIAPGQIFEYAVITTPPPQAAGVVDGIWTDAGDEVEFVGVRHGLGTTMHLAPVRTAQIDHSHRVITLPFSYTQLSGAPTRTFREELTEADREEIYRYYGMSAG